MPAPSGAALLLAQLGGRVAAQFASQLEPLGLRPTHVAVLRAIAAEPGVSQQHLARRLAVAPSRIVTLVDELQDAGLVLRLRSLVDRRNHELRLAPAGTARLRDVRAVVRRHDAAVVAALTPTERELLVDLLVRVAAGLDERPTR